MVVWTLILTSKRVYNKRVCGLVVGWEGTKGFDSVAC